MIERTRIQDVVFAAVDGVNELLLEEHALRKDEKTVLVGDGAALDSMGFVNFVVALEQQHQQAFGREVNLAEQLSSAGPGAQRVSTIGELIDFLASKSK